MPVIELKADSCAYIYGVPALYLSGQFVTTWQELHDTGGLLSSPMNGPGFGWTFSPKYPPPDNWWLIERSYAIFKYLPFYLSNAASINSAKLVIYDFLAQVSEGANPMIGVYLANTVSDDFISIGDWNSYTNILISPLLPFSNYLYVPGQEELYTLEIPLDLSYVHKNEILKIAIMEAAYDHANIEPPHDIYIPNSQNMASGAQSYTVPRTNALSIVIDYNEIPTAELPIIVTVPATEITTTQATLNGQLVNDGGEACNTGFEVGPTIDLGTSIPVGSNISGENISATITGDPGTTYYFRAVAENGAGFAYGDILSLTLGTEPPPEECPFQWWLLILGAAGGYIIKEAAKKERR